MAKITGINQALDRAYQELAPFSGYYERERKTYRFLLNLILQSGRSLRMMDVGTGIGIVPLALKLLGSESCGVDKFIFGTEGLESLKKVWQEHNLSISEMDMAQEKADLSRLGQFDVVLSSSTIEHVQSPRIFLQNISRLLKTGGKAVILTPNAAFIAKRIRFLFGFSPLCELKKFFDSDGEKFSGHWREYTLKELKQVCAWAGLKIIKAQHVDNSPWRVKSLRDCYYFILKLFTFLWPGGQRAIFVVCQK